MQLGGKTYEGDSNEASCAMRAAAGTEGPPQRGSDLPTCRRQPEHHGSEHGLRVHTWEGGLCWVSNIPAGC